MSVHFISGKPGGGKTLYSVRLIMEELANGSRQIVTNVPLKLPEVNAYLQKFHPKAFERYFEFKQGDTVVAVLDAVKHISERIILIDEDEMSSFFTFRGHGVRLKSLSNVEWRDGKRPDYSAVKDSGVFYVLDEVHIAFNSRAWALTGNEVLYYLSQHRKLGDDVVCITQSVNNVDKQFRSVAQDYTYIKNLSKQRVGLMRLPSMFLRSTYPCPATPTVSPMESGAFKLDVSGLAACYDTAKGVGIHGRTGADTKERKCGIHWLFFAVAIPVVGWLLLHYFPIFVAHHLNHPAFKPPVQNQKINLPVAVSPVLVVTQFVEAINRYQPLQTNSATGAGGSFPASSGADVSPAISLYCTGYGGAGQNWKAFLSDGTVATSASGRLTKIMEDYVVVDGWRLPIHAKPKVEKPGDDLQPVSLPDVEPRYIPVPMLSPLPPPETAPVPVLRSPVTVSVQGVPSRPLPSYQPDVP